MEEEEDQEALPRWADKIVCFLAYGHHHDTHDSELSKTGCFLNSQKTFNLIFCIERASCNIILKLKKNTKSFILAFALSQHLENNSDMGKSMGGFHFFCGGMGTTTTTLVTIQSHIGNNTLWNCASLTHNKGELNS
jgi:hypothetical protein